ncbi:MAG: hypothetical protein Q7U52_09985 [Hydrogenophaga sp.]|nr:hypothetical protein [Hydrogenophaga sp.]
MTQVTQGPRRIKTHQGYCESELLRRFDPPHRSVGQFFQAEQRICARNFDVTTAAGALPPRAIAHAISTGSGLH